MTPRHLYFSQKRKILHDLVFFLKKKLMIEKNSGSLAKTCPEIKESRSGKDLNKIVKDKTRYLAMTI